MNLSNKNILLISPEPWDHIFVSKHHYATHLAKSNNKVYFLNPPKESSSISVNKTTYENLFTIDYKGFIKGLRFLPRKIQKYFIGQKFKKLEKAANVKFDLVWSFDNSVFYDFDSLPKSIYSISHIVDLNQDFNTKIAAKSADLCIGVKKEIVDRLKCFNKNTILIPHGVQEFTQSSEKVILPGKNRIKALYMGNLAMKHIDWELLNMVVKKNVNVDFILMGDGIDQNNNKYNIAEQNNIYLLGRIFSTEIGLYLNSADILLSLYDGSYASNYATPHKIMEYLASGKIISSTWIAEYDQLYENGLILMSKTQYEFLENFKKLIENLDEFNSKENQEKRKVIAKSNSYFKQLERITDSIKSI